jgi:hypothetical protein
MKLCTFRWKIRAHNLLVGASHHLRVAPLAIKALTGRSLTRVEGELSDNLAVL